MQVEFPPDWRVLRDLRTFVGKLVTSVIESDDVAARVSMVVTELAENVVKYSVETASVVRLSVEPTATGIRCETENRASAKNIKQLEKTLSVATSLDQMELRKANFSLSGQLKTLDGTYALDEMGGQIGELTPLGQLELDEKNPEKLKFISVYPHETATGKPVYPRP